VSRWSWYSGAIFGDALNEVDRMQRRQTPVRRVLSSLALVAVALAIGALVIAAVVLRTGLF